MGKTPHPRGLWTDCENGIIYGMKISISAVLCLASLILTNVFSAPFPTDGVAVGFGYAYALSSSSNACNLLVYDLSSVGDFPLCATFPLDQSETSPETDPVLFGDVLYVPFYSGFDVLDVSNPVKPSFSCHCDCGRIGKLQHLSISNKTTVVAIGSNGVMQFDVSDAFSPVLSGGFVHDGSPSSSPNIDILKLCDESFIDLPLTNAFASPFNAVARDGRGFIVAACGHDGIKVFKESSDSSGTNDQHSAVLVTRRKTLGDARAVCILNGCIWVADGTRGVSVYSLDDWGLITHVRDYSLLSGSATAISCDSNTVFITGDDGSIWTLPADPSRRHVLKKAENLPN